jgi:hypothetical protein
MTSRHEYIEKFKNKLDEWDTDIDELEAGAKRAKADMKNELDDQIIILRLKRDIARLKLSEIMEASEEAWEDVKQGAEEAWTEVRHAMEKAKSHF